MKYNILGHTGVYVSAVSLGTATFGVAPRAEDTRRIIDAAIDLGINLIDTANSYGNQTRFDRPGAPPAAQRDAAEILVGHAIKQKRSQVVLCSKVMEPVGSGLNDRGLSRRHIFQQIEQSLCRLQTDHLDVYYAHHPDPYTPIDETVHAFHDLIRQGKIRYWALSTFSACQIIEVLWRADRFGGSAPVCVQVPYNVVNRDVERDLSPVCQTYGLSLTAFSPIAGGLLAGQRARSRDYVGRRRWGGAGFTENQEAKAARFDAIALGSGLEPAALAVAWLASKPLVATAIVGPESVEELSVHAAAADLTLSSDVLSAIDQISDPNMTPSAI